MFTRLKRFLAPPVFQSDDEKTCVAELLNALLLTVAASAGTYVLATAVTRPDEIPQLMLRTLPVFLVLFGSWFVMRRGRVRLASLLLSLSLYVILALFVATTGGIKAPAFNGYIVLVLISGFLLGFRAGLGFAGLGILTGVILAVAESNGSLPQPAVARTTSSYLIAQTVYLFAASTALYFAWNSLQKALGRTRDECSERLRSEEAYRALVDGPLQGLLIVQDDRILFANQAFAAMSGYTVEELLALSSEEIPALVHPADRKPVLGFYQEGRNQKEVLDRREWRRLRKDGTMAWVETHANWIEFQGKPAIQMTVLDVTERKRAEDLVRAQRDLALRLGAAVGLDETLRLCVEAAIQDTGMDAGGVYLLDETSGQLNLAFSQGLTPDFVQATSHYDADSASARLVMAGQPIYVNYQELGVPTDETRRREGLRVVAILPVHHENRVIACLNVASRSLDQIPAVARDTLEVIAAQIGSFVARAQAEEALRESEERLKLALEAANDGLFDWNMRTGEAYFSPRYRAMLGYEPDEMLASSDFWMNSLHPEDREYALNTVSEYGEGKREGHENEFRMRTKSGGWRWILSRGRVSERDASGTPMRMVGTHVDITDRKQAEEALRESEEKYRLLAENVDDVLWVRDKNLDRYTYVSPSITRLLGYTPEEVMTKPLSDLITPASYQRVRQGAERRLAAEAAGLGDDETRIWETEYIRKDGSTVWVESRTRPLRDKGGQFQCLIGVTRDITERVQAEEERQQLLAQVQEQAQQVQQVISTVPDGVVLLDADLRILIVNPAGWGHLDALTDARWGETLTHLGERPLAELLTSPRPGLWHEVETDGRSFEVLARPIETGPETEGWVLVIRDVTQQREIERRIQQQERLAAVGQLAAGIAHDFNNIMAVIVLYAKMSLRLPGLPPKVGEHMETISRQARRATELIRQILDFSRRAALERRPMDLMLFLKEQVRMLERMLPEHIQIDLAYGPDEYTVEADPTRLQQIVMNLAVNARDAMPQGGRLRIRLEQIQVKRRKEAPLSEMLPGNWVRVTVSDDGTGIPPDVLPHVFDPFFTTKAPGEGTGLGLAQVWGIVKQHEGHIDVTTTAGEGTSFTLYLPALNVTEPETLPEEEGDVIEGQGETILVVEDNLATREALVNCLESLNYRVLEATNGQEALATVEQEQEEIRLVLSDAVMPVMGGMALFHALRQKDLPVPMVMLTGHPVEKELKNLEGAGLSGWLLKPPSPEQLARVVRQALKEGSK